MDALAIATERTPAPLDIVEQVLIEEHYPYQRDSIEAHFAVEGAWSDHQLWFLWREDVRVLELCVALDIRPPSGRRGELCDLIARINERLGLGHFDAVDAERALVYRVSVPVLDASVTPLQASTMIAAALDAADRFYPAFNFLIWAGKSARDAVEAAMLDTAGQA